MWFKIDNWDNSKDEKQIGNIDLFIVRLKRYLKMFKLHII